MTVSSHEVPVGENGLVRVPDHEDPSPSEQPHVVDPPVEAELFVLRNIGGPVVSLLQESRAVIVISALSVVPGIQDHRVVVHRPREDARGCLHQVPEVV